MNSLPDCHIIASHSIHGRRFVSKVQNFIPEFITPDKLTIIIAYSTLHNETATVSATGSNRRASPVWSSNSTLWFLVLQTSPRRGLWDRWRNNHPRLRRSSSGSGTHHPGAPSRCTATQETHLYHTLLACPRSSAIRNLDESISMVYWTDVLRYEIVTSTN